MTVTLDSINGNMFANASVNGDKHGNNETSTSLNGKSQISGLDDHVKVWNSSNFRRIAVYEAV